MTKQELRKKIRGILPLPPHLRAEKSRRICEAIAQRPEWSRAKTVLFFAPQEREPDVELLCSPSLEKRLVYPKVIGDTLALYAVDSIYDLVPAQWGLREPRENEQMLVQSHEVDLVLVPGVAFTKSGLRCGRGGGFYDRLLGELPASTAKIGVCFSEQIVDELPTEPHDLAVDFVVSA